MNVIDALRSSFGRSQMVTQMLTADLSDDEIMQRPVPGANHIAWQLGHLASSYQFFGSAVREGSMPALPDGFAEKHGKENAGNDDPAEFMTKEQYLQLLDQQREALQNLLSELTEDDLAAATPADMQAYAPTIADMLGLASEHEMMHSGQISVLRRKLGKPVAF